MELVAFVGTDDENWGQITALLRRANWEKVILIRDKRAAAFPSFENAEEIIVDTEQPLLAMREEMHNKLSKMLKGDFEVSLSIASGNGKEHMALISALINIPVGIRLVAYTKSGVEVIT